MSNTVFVQDDYLERVQLSSVPPTTEDGLETLHRAQAYTIAFENFDILLGRGISLEPADIFAKLVRRARGGYCFELNGLLRMALESFGFNVRPLLARVHVRGTPTGRTHMLLLVTLGGRDWIADAGFGGPGLKAPIPLELDRPAMQDGQQFRLVERPPFGVMLETRAQAAHWQNLYSFDLGHVEPADIVCGNHFTSTHPTSFFTFSRVAALPLANGRVSLVDRSLTTVTGGVERVDTLDDGDAYVDALERHFGIVLGEPHTALRPLEHGVDSAPA